MASLFENYIGIRLKKIATKEGYFVALQKYGKPCLRIFNKDGYFFTKPDILIKNLESNIHIVDTKWKILTKKRDYGVKNPDVYQILAYGEAYNATQLTLLYPHNLRLDGEGSKLHGTVNDQGRELSIFSIDLANLDIRHENNQLLKVIQGVKSKS